MGVKCFDVAMISIDEATKKFEPGWKLNGEKLDLFKKCCESCDKIIREFDGMSFEFDINEGTKDILVTMTFQQISIGGKNHYLYELFKAAETCAVDINSEDSGAFDIMLTFKPIWDYVE